MLESEHFAILNRYGSVRVCLGNSDFGQVQKSLESYFLTKDSLMYTFSTDYKLGPLIKVL